MAKNKIAHHNRTGVWIVGARGDIATTLIVGVEALKRGQISSSGMTTEIPPTSDLDMIEMDELVIGGLDIIENNLTESATTVGQRSGTFSTELVKLITPELNAIDQDIICEPQASWEAGVRQETSLNITSFITRLRKHLHDFSTKHQLKHTVVVNLSSSEHLPDDSASHDTLEGIEQLITDNRQDLLSPSICYTYAAFQEGCSYINFTPNPGIDLKGLQQLAEQKNLPFYGNDGKTGETLVKTALAPMFLYRNLKILSWEGVNMLGNGDGRTLNDPGHKVAKLRNKANVLDSILGYSPHAGIDINYVPSLGDWKTAWDLIHFQGFLDVKMSMQFTWQGCDSILAAPLVLDMIRLSEYAARHGESGPMKHLAAFFKNPLDCEEMALHPQFQRLIDYIQAHLDNDKTNTRPRLAESSRQ
jgi:myo-inositol-1-phosphate synthase